MSAFIIVPVGKLESGHCCFHTQVPEEFLVMVRSGASDEKHGRLSLKSFSVHGNNFAGFRFFFSYDIFNLLSQLRVIEILCDLSQTLGHTVDADKVDLYPWYAECGFHHFGHIVDGSVAHHEVKISLVGSFHLIDGCVSAERGNYLDTAFGKDPFYFPGVTTDIVFA